MKKTLLFKASVITYYVYGDGSEVVFCFHGYGLTGESFAVLQPVLSADHTLICIDFPFHGDTNWLEGLFFSDEDLWEILQQISPKPNNPFSLLGYSMGGRIALHLLQTHPTIINQVALIAPHGLKFNWWQQVATHTAIGNQLFRYTMQHPQWLLAFIKISSLLHLLNKGREKFTLGYISDAHERQLLYKRWCAMRAFKPQLSTIRKLINQHKIPVNLLFGEYDQVITTSQGLAFKKEEPLITVKELKCGHQILKEKYATDVADLLIKTVK